MQYQTGSVSVVNDDATVTGSGVLFITDGVQAGDVFKVRGENAFYIVSSVPNEYTLELTTVYAGTTQSDVAYSITSDFTSNFEWYELFVNDKDWDQHYTANWRSLDSILGAITQKTNSATVTTTDDTETTLMSIPLDDNTVYQIEARIVARCTDANDSDISDVGMGASYTMIGTFKRYGSVATLIGSLTSVHVAEDVLSDSGVVDWAATLDVDGNNVRVRVTGGARDVVNWQCAIIVQKVA